MNEKIEFKHEGQTLEDLQKSKDQDNAGGSDDTKKDPAENGAADGAADAGAAKPKPFNEDPEVQSYIERQLESRLTKVEEKHQQDLAALREEIAEGRKPSVTAEKPPQWFGGNQAQWDEFKGWVEQRTAGVGDGVIKTLAKTKEQEEAAVAEATKFLQSEIATIQSDKTLNPKGVKVNAEELLKTALENELIDTKGRWNYRAAWRIMRQQAEVAAAGAKPDPERKKIADASTKTDKGSDPGAKTFKTSEDFKKKRPW